MDTLAGTYKYNYEYYLLKHVSHFVKPGAKRLNTTGAFTDLLAFANVDKSIVVIAQNEGSEEKRIKIKLGNKVLEPLLGPNTFNTFLLK